MSEGTHAPTPRAMDNAKLQQFIGKMLGDLGGAANVPLVRMVGAQGLYRVLHTRGPMTCAELTQQAKVHQCYLLT